MKNNAFGSDEGPDADMPFVWVAEFVQYSSAWQADHRVYNTVNMMDSLRRVLGASVDPVDRTLFRGDGVR